MDSRIPEPMKFTGNLAENFRKFKQNFEIYLAASDRSNRKGSVKVAILLNAIGDEGVEIYNGFKLTDNKKNNYDEVMKEFEKFANAGRNVIYERFRFFTRNQNKDESLLNFVADLKCLANTCEFKDQKESLIRDRIIAGINDRSLQNKLLQIKNLDLNRAISECQAVTMVSTQIQQLQMKIDDLKKQNTTVEQSTKSKGQKRREKKARQKNELEEQIRHMKKDNENIQEYNNFNLNNLNINNDDVFCCFTCGKMHGKYDCKLFTL